MTDPDPHSSMTRRRLLGATGGTLAGLTALAGAGGGAGDAGVNRQDSTSTPTPTPTATPIPAVEWPVFQFDGHNSGHSPSNVGPRDAVGARWRHGEGGDYTTTPLVTRSSIFAADEGNDVVRGINRDDGTQRWQTPLSVSNARLVVEGDTIYVPTDESGAELQALGVTDGTPRWTVDLGVSANSLVATDTSIYVGTPQGVTKVSTLSNSIQWRYDGVTLIDTGIAVADNALYVADTQNGKTVRVSMAQGSASWERFLEAPAHGAPTVVDGYVVVPTEDGLVALDEGTGDTRWRYDATVEGSVVVADGTVYGTTRSGDAFALELDDRTVRWRTSAVGGSNPPILAGGLLYLTGPGGRVMALDPATGATVWAAALDAEIAANPSVAGSELYVGDRGGRLWALSSDAGSTLDGSTPTRTETPTETEGTSGDSTDTPTEGSMGTDTTTPIDLDGDEGDETSPPSTQSSGPETASGGDGDGGLNLGLLSAGAAAVVALLGGGLWWRNQQQDEYDPLG